MNRYMCKVLYEYRTGGVGEIEVSVDGENIPEAYKKALKYRDGDIKRVLSVLSINFVAFQVNIQ